MASGRFLSASKPDLYRFEEETAGRSRRMVRMNEPVTLLPPARDEACALRPKAPIVPAIQTTAGENRPRAMKRARYDPRRR